MLKFDFKIINTTISRTWYSGFLSIPFSVSCTLSPNVCLRREPTTSVFLCNYTPSPLIPRPLSPWLICIQWVASRDVLQYRTWKKQNKLLPRISRLVRFLSCRADKKAKYLNCFVIVLSTFSNSQYRSTWHVCTWETVQRSRGGVRSWTCTLAGWKASDPWQQKTKRLFCTVERRMFINISNELISSPPPHTPLNNCTFKPLGKNVCWPP